MKRALMFLVLAILLTAWAGQACAAGEFTSRYGFSISFADIEGEWTNMTDDTMQGEMYCILEDFLKGDLENYRNVSILLSEDDPIFAEYEYAMPELIPLLQEELGAGGSIEEQKYADRSFVRIHFPGLYCEDVFLAIHRGRLYTINMFGIESELYAGILSSIVFHDEIAAAAEVISIERSKETLLNGLLTDQVIDIPRGHLSVRRPVDYYAVAREGNDSETIARATSAPRHVFDIFLTVNDNDLYLLPEGQTIGISDSRIKIHVKENSRYEGYDFRMMSDEAIAAYGSTLVSGFEFASTDSEYLGLYKSDALNFVKVKFGSDQIRYVTIIGNQLTYIIGEYTGDSITDAQASVLEAVVSSMRMTD